MRWVDEVYEALTELGGAARYIDLYEYFEAATERELPRTWQAIIRRTIEDHSRDSANFRGKDLFERLGRGFWGIRGIEVDDDMLSEREALSPKQVVERVLVRELERAYPTRPTVSLSDRQFHLLPAAPRPVAPFSHAVEADGWVILTGQMPTNPAEPDAPLPEGIAAQAARVMDNLALVLGELGLGLEHVVQCRCFLTHFERDYAGFNAVYARYFPPDRLPARTTVGVTALVLGALVEVDCVARRP